MVTVENGVSLEVLDWGGTGLAFVLLAGSGNTAHVYDDFAPKLRQHCHVYGITRRGYGASSQPDSGYGDQRLAADVLQVLDSLKIEAPVLAGHSMAGAELTTIGREHAKRISGLVYLDALGDPRDWPGSDPAYMALFKNLPPSKDPVIAPASAEEKKSFAGSRAAQLRTTGFSFPESELRNSYETNPDGTKGRFKTPGKIHQAIGDGQIQRNYSGISVPVLALFEFIHAERENDPDKRAFAEATDAYVGRWVNNLLSGVADVHLIDLPGAGHYVFLTRESQVLEGIQRYLSTLPY